MNDICVDNLNKIQNTRFLIACMEDEMKKVEQLELPPKHYFAKGLYARELFMPAGTLITSKVHKSEHICIISKGCLYLVMVTDGNTERIHIKAPYTFVSHPGNTGTKRILYIEEDTVWTTVHATNEKDISKLEDELVSTDYCDSKSLKNEMGVQSCLGDT